MLEENTEQEAEKKERQTGQRHSMKHLLSLQVCPMSVVLTALSVSATAARPAGCG